MAAASHDGAVRCLLAIELSKKSWIVAVNTPLSDKISRHMLQACDWKELLELIERIRTRVSQTFSRPMEVISCYEAGYDGFWLHRLLEAHGVRNFVIDPASVQVDRRARRWQPRLRRSRRSDELRNRHRRRIVRLPCTRIMTVRALGLPVLLMP